MNIAFVRSSYHVELLRKNIRDDVFYVFLIDIDRSDLDHSIFIGVESSKFSFSSIIYNKKYYDRVSGLCDSPSVDKIIVFNDYSPLSKYIISNFSGKIECWEDGLNHYLDEHNGVIYFLKSFLKVLLGYCGYEFFKIHSGDGLPVYDRFINSNLVYQCLPIPFGADYDVFLGQPLIEDGFIDKETFLVGLQKLIRDKSISNLVYLPHPREVAIGDFDFSENVVVANVCSHGCKNSEEYLAKYGCNRLFSAFSTVNINVDLPLSNNFYVPGYFRLNGIKEKLLSLKFLKVSVE